MIVAEDPKARYLHPTGDTTWPAPSAAGDLERKLRYSPARIDRCDELILASICSAYGSLAKHPAGVEQLERLRKAVKNAD